MKNHCRGSREFFFIISDDNLISFILNKLNLQSTYYSPDHPPDINEDSCSDIVAILVFNNEHIWSVKKYENAWYSLDSLSEEPQTIPFRRIFARQGFGWIIIRNHSGLRVNDEAEEHTIVNMKNKKTSRSIADQSPKLKRRRRRVEEDIVTDESSSDIEVNDFNRFEILRTSND
ncbi:unnamed protein product [Adineta ricciae]|uniref:Uncharacterized protein n=1 Tax=Adineta ricciae TaxID=249248 RepID=A0A815URU0_ADIRI|nr:unnamed protein product [Adineta ricciae]CAF1522776.1 unnamed protein product [Adineta ricciae]